MSGAPKSALDRAATFREGLAPFVQGRSRVNPDIDAANGAMTTIEEIP
jgi:hypothetical protein